MVSYRCSSLVCLILVLALAVSAPTYSQVQWGPVVWSDDRGEPLPPEEEFELCWIHDLDRDCDRVAARSLPERFPAFDILQIESSGHGPVSIEPQEMETTEHGVHRLQVPRKAWLQIAGLPSDGAVNLSLYSQESPASPRPLLRRRALEGEAFRIPAGAFIASLTAKGWAPFLSLLDADPGEQLTVEYQHRQGWSLVLQTSNKQTGEPIEGTQVEVEPAAGYSGLPEEKRQRSNAETNSFGLAVFSGLQEPVIEAAFIHSAFLPVQVPGLSATRGTFGYREVPLPQGGGIEVSIVLEAKPVEGAECSLLKYQREVPGSQAAAEEVLGASTDEQGFCRARNLREGQYQLRVRLPRVLAKAQKAKPSHVDQTVTILEGQDTSVEVVLQPTRLEGTVYRGQEPAPGYEVMVHDPGNRVRNASALDALIRDQTDEDGEYAVTLWTSGEYRVFVQNQNGVPGAMKTVRLHGGTETVDFHLAATEIAGRVVDEAGRPLEEAYVQLKWKAFSNRLAVTGAKGHFTFPVEEDGQVALTARKQGYRSPDPLEFQVGPDSSPEPVVLTLEKRPEVRGRLATATGAPVAGGWLAAYRLEVQEPVLVATVETGPDGHFELPVVPGADHRVYFGGPQCPLGVRSLKIGPNPADPLEIHCAEAPAHLQLTLRTPDGSPREGAGLLLARGRVVYPRQVLAGHLARLGLSAATDGSGHLALVALEPGEYRLYLAGATSPFNILVGAPDGFLTTATLAPWSTRVAEITLDEGTLN